MHVRGEDLQQSILDDDGQAESSQQRGEWAGAQAASQHGAVQEVAKYEHHRHYRKQRDEW
ncbi:MAG: hypothetical protein WB586_24400 [Chthoniobacterales bacterium]